MRTSRASGKRLHRQAGLLRLLVQPRVEGEPPFVTLSGVGHRDPNGDAPDVAIRIGNQVDRANGRGAFSENW
jgi:hypothetical protein